MKKASRVAIYGYNLMKISLTQIAILILLTGVSYAENALGQNVLNKSITLELKDASLLEAIDHLEEKLGVKFAYSEYFIESDSDHNISLNAKDEKAYVVLTELLEPLKLTYEPYGDQIVIRKDWEVKKVKKKHNSFYKTIEQKFNNFLASLKKKEAVVFIQKDPITIQGKVTSIEDGEPLPGATVMIKGTTIGSITDIDGNYSIEIPDGHENPVLIFSSIGFVEEEVPVRGLTTINIGLSFSISQLEEVVVVGYGEQKRQSVVAAISQVEGKELLKAGTTQSVSQSLQGMIPGLTIVNSDGLPGKGAHAIQIRGVSTTGNMYPLTIVDGIERSIHNLDPNAIESISILKDASATAVYGVRGANGVIMITTKRGQVGKPKFNFSANFGFKVPTKNQQHADYITTMEMYNEAVANDGSWHNLIPESTINAWKENIDQAGPYNQYFPQIDWWDELVKDYGLQQRYNLNARGGTKFMKYFVSLGYLNEGDIFNTDLADESEFGNNFGTSFGFKRYNWRSNFDFDLTKTTEFSISFAGNARRRTEPVFGPSRSGIFNNMRNLPNNAFPIKYPDGEWGDSKNGGDNYLVLFNEGGHEFHKAYEGFYDASLKQDLDFITKGLSFKGKISYTSHSDYFSTVYTDRSSNASAALTGSVRYNREFDYTQPMEGPDGTITYPMIEEQRHPSDEYIGGRPILATYDDFRGYGRKLFYQFSTHYKRKFGKHAVSGLALMNRQMHMTSGSSADFPFPSYREDWVGRVTYGYDDKYLLEVNGAYTGSEKFAPGKRFGFFPSFSVGWVISNESFVQDLTGSFLNFLKIRYSNGKMGSDQGAPRFAYTQIYTVDNKRKRWARFGLVNSDYYGPIYYEDKAANPNQTWETSYKENLGIDFDLFNKLSGTVELYKERREGILMDLQTVPIWMGVESPSGNIAATKNRGYEISLKWNDRIGTDFTYYIRADLSQFENRIVKYDDPRMEDDYKKHAGKPLHWDRQAPKIINSGYYSSLDDIYNNPLANHGLPMNKLVPGDLMYVDFNADGRTNNEDRVPLEHQLYPATILGVGLGFSYKNFDVSALFYGVTDVRRTLPRHVVWDFAGQLVTAQSDVASRWTPETAAYAEKPALHLEHDHNQTGSTYLNVDGSYLRLENIEIAYRLKSARLSALGINRVRIFANGSDLFTWTKDDTIIDPEAFGSGTYPVVKRYNFGLRVAF